MSVGSRILGDEKAPEEKPRGPTFFREMVGELVEMLSQRMTPGGTRSLLWFVNLGLRMIECEAEAREMFDREAVPRIFATT